MTEPSRDGMAGRGLTGYGQAAPAVRRPESANLADILERVLDKGIVIAGDIQVNLLDIELLTIKLRLVIASVDRAKEMGIDWWEHDPTLSSKAARHEEMIEENRRLRERLAALEGEEDERDRQVERRQRRAVNRPEQADRPERSERPEQRSVRSGRYEDRPERSERGSHRPPEENGGG